MLKTFFNFFRNKIKIQHGNTFILGKNVGLSKCFISIKGKNNILTIGSYSRLRDVVIEIIGDNCTIEIGEYCIIGHGSYLSAKEKNIKLTIGKNCMFSRNINILTSDGHPIFQEEDRINPAKDIIIGNHVWLADNVTVLKGTIIGNDTVIGIHSLVTRSIPNNSIAAGVPAKVIKTKTTWKN